MQDCYAANCRKCGCSLKSYYHTLQARMLAENATRGIGCPGCNADVILVEGVPTLIRLALKKKE